MLSEIIIYWIGLFIFLAATITFFAIGRKKEVDKFLSTSDIFVSFITAISYAVMALSLATVTSISGELIYWSRWLFYTASCSILTVDVAIIYQKKAPMDLFKTVALTVLVMFCGFLASIIIDLNKWIFFGLSSTAYAGLIYQLFTNVNLKVDKMKRNMMWWVLVFWSLFPVVWILAPTGFGMFTTFFESIFYLLLDIISKIAFGFYITLSHE